MPNQNKAVEFNHNQQIQWDMVSIVRTAILQSKSTGDDQYAEVEMGDSVSWPVNCDRPGAAKWNPPDE